jgi:cob(I)alamin adenosyltransferase
MTGMGLIQVYTGNGKGKTTASLGLAFRAVGHGFKVCMIGFMKNCPDYGEVKAAQLLPGFKLIQVGRNEFVNLENPAEIDKKLAQDGWQQAKAAIESGDWDIVILDELNVAMACKLVNTDEVAAFLKAQKRPVEIVLTGRYALDSIVELADLVTEMREIKHPFNSGLKSRPGIDF